MKSQIFCLVLITSTVFADWCDHVKSIKLDYKNYDQYVGGSKHLIVDFYAPWCSHCQKLGGAWNQIYQKYNEQQVNDILIAKMNCDSKEDNQICIRFGVESFPTIIHFEPQSLQGVEYTGHRTFQQISEWIDQVCYPIQAQQIQQIQEDQ